MDVQLRSYQPEDFVFARRLYFETMRERIEPIFGWIESVQNTNFAEWFKPDEVTIITADGSDVGWIQQRQDAGAIFLVSIYIIPSMQRKGIGTQLVRTLLDLARQKHQAVTLAVMKINPAFALYKRLGFQVTHEDEHKLYMRSEDHG